MGFLGCKGGVQNVVGDKVLELLVGVVGMKGSSIWVIHFMAPREFEVSWDGKVRGIGWSATRVPQGLPLSSAHFLVWMTPILNVDGMVNCGGVAKCWCGVSLLQS